MSRTSKLDGHSKPQLDLKVWQKFGLGNRGSKLKFFVFLALALGDMDLQHKHSSLTDIKIPPYSDETNPQLLI